MVVFSILGSDDRSCNCYPIGDSLFNIPVLFNRFESKTEDCPKSAVAFPAPIGDLGFILVFIHLYLLLNVSLSDGAQASSKATKPGQEGKVIGTIHLQIALHGALRLYLIRSLRLFFCLFWSPTSSSMEHFDRILREGRSEVHRRS